MITYTEGYDLLSDRVFADRVRYAILRTAAFILIENTQTPDHLARTDWASKVFAEKIQMPLRQMLMYVITDAAVAQDGSAVSDAALQGAVDANVSRFITGG